MKKACLVPLALGLALWPGCWVSDGGGWQQGDDALRSFETDSSECSLVSTLALSNSRNTWTGCRLRYDDRSGVYTWQLQTPETTGSWTAQGPGWLSLSFDLESPERRTLPLSNVTAEQPPFVPVNEVVFAYAPTAGAIVGATGSISVGSNVIYSDGTDSALDAQFFVDAVGFGTFSGTISAIIGPATEADAATASCADDGGCAD